jgi:hypothetical protein
MAVFKNENDVGSLDWCQMLGAQNFDLSSFNDHVEQSHTSAQQKLRNDTFTVGSFEVSEVQKFELEEGKIG